MCTFADLSLNWRMREERICLAWRGNDVQPNHFDKIIPKFGQRMKKYSFQKDLNTKFHIKKVIKNTFWNGRMFSIRWDFCYFRHSHIQYIHIHVAMQQQHQYHKTNEWNSTFSHDKCWWEQNPERKTYNNRKIPSSK